MGAADDYIGLRDVRLCPASRSGQDLECETCGNGWWLVTCWIFRTLRLSSLVVQVVLFCPTVIPLSFACSSTEPPPHPLTPTSSSNLPSDCPAAIGCSRPITAMKVKKSAKKQSPPVSIISPAFLIHDPSLICCLAGGRCGTHQTYTRSVRRRPYQRSQTISSMALSSWRPSRLDTGPRSI